MKKTLILAALLAIQLTFVSGRFGQPFLDGRNHWHFDCASFLLRAVHSLAPDLRSPRDVFGLTEYAYDDANLPTIAGYYSHHGVALPTMLRAAVAVFGPTEATVNALMILLSLAATVLMFNIVRRATRHDGLSFCIVLLYILLPLKFLYTDKVKYEIAVELLLLLCMDLLARLPAWRPARPLFLAAFFLTFQTDFYAFIPAVLLWIVVWRRRGEPGLERLPIQALLAGGLGLATTLVLQYALGFHPAEVARIASYRATLGGSSVTAAGYIARQWTFLLENLGGAAMILGLSSLLVMAWRRRQGLHPAGVLGLIFLGGGAGWMLLMRNHSYIHHFAQWMFVTACPLLLAGAAAALEGPPPAAAPSRNAPLLCGALLPFLLLTAFAARRALGDFRGSDLSTPQDIVTLRTLDKRLVVLSDGPSGPMEWWFSPVVRLYTDPVFRNSTRVGVVRADQAESLDPANDLLVVLNEPASWPGLRKRCASEYDIATMEPVQASATFVYFRFTLAEPASSDEYLPAQDDEATE